MNSRARRSDVRTMLLVAGLLIAWLAVIALQLYDFRSSDALASLRAQLPYYGDMFTRVPRNFGALSEALLFLFSGWGSGDLICAKLGLRFRTAALRVASALCVGFILWTFVVMAAGAMQRLGGPLLPAVLAVGAVFSVLRLFTTRGEWRAQLGSGAAVDRWTRFIAIAALVLLVVALYLALLGALQPEMEFDARLYHLTMAKRYVQHGGFYNLGIAEGLPTMDFPQYQEYLYTAGYQLFGMIGAKVLSWSMLLIDVTAVIGVGAELFGSMPIGLLAAALFTTTPIVSWSATTAATDLGQGPVFLLALYGVARWRERKDQLAWLLFAGALCGYATGIKPFALAGCAVLGGWVAVMAVRKRSVAPLGVFAGGAIAAALPGLVRTGLLTGDPLFPIGATLFHAHPWSPTFSQILHASYHVYGARTSWWAFPLFPWLLTMRVDQYRGVVGPLYLLVLPFVVFYALRTDSHPLFRPFLVLLLGWGVLWLASTAIEARYAESVFPIVTLMAAFVALSPGARSLFGMAAQRLLAVVLLALTALNLQPFVLFQRHASLPYVMGVVHYQWDYIYGSEAESDVQLRYAPMLAWMNAHLNPERDRVYDDTDDYLYNLYSDIELFAAQYARGMALETWSLESRDAGARLRSLGIDYVLTDASAEPTLTRLPLGAHLRQIHIAPSVDPGSTDVLYWVASSAKSMPAIGPPTPRVAPGFYRYANGPTVYRIAPSAKPCHVVSVDEMQAFGGFAQVKVVAPSANLPVAPGASVPPCAWPHPRS